MTCIELCVIGQKLSTTLKSEDLAILVFKEKFTTHPSKPAEVEPRFLATNLLPFTGPGLRPTVQNST